MSESLDFYQTFINEHPELRVWFFSGENDAVLPTIGTFRWMDKLKLGIKTEFRQWHFLNQVGGHVQEYENGLTLVTVKAAGHMVPQDQRESSFAMLTAFLNGKLPE
jgi:carboxypeptidase C (cathepsin A)